MLFQAALRLRSSYKLTQLSRYHVPTLTSYLQHGLSGIQSHSKFASRTNMNLSVERYEKNFQYTGGRWLWDEEAQLQQRYLKFDVKALKRIAAQCVGAKTCVSISKIAEGGYNRVFRLVMDDKKTLIAKFPYPLVCSTAKTTASEVATMEFARTILGLPVPEVYSWNTNASNPVGAEYILMGDAPGTQLGTLWNTMSIDSKMKITEQLVEVEKKLASISFNRYGNIYFAEDSFSGCVEAEIRGDIDEALRSTVSRRFVIGPVVDQAFWDKERSSMDIDRGPWLKPDDYILAVATREIKWISQHASPETSEQCQADAIQEHISVYRKLEDIAPYILPRGDLSAATLWHWDLHAWNLFVENNTLTCLIDWQFAWTGPLFLQYRQPKLVDYNGPVMLRLPDDFNELQNGQEKDRIRKQVESSILLYSYEQDTAEHNPNLRKILLMPNGSTLKHVMDFSVNTWDRDIIPFRECLIKIKRDWDNIAPNTPCTIHFTQEEIDKHLQDGESWNERADFWDRLDGFVARDGWTANENYDEARKLFADLRDEGLQSLKGVEREKLESRSRWAT